MNDVCLQGCPDPRRIPFQRAARRLLDQSTHFLAEIESGSGASAGAMEQRQRTKKKVVREEPVRDGKAAMVWHESAVRNVEEVGNVEGVLG